MGNPKLSFLCLVLRARGGSLSRLCFSVSDLPKWPRREKLTGHFGVRLTHGAYRREKRQGKENLI